MYGSRAIADYVRAYVYTNVGGYSKIHTAHWFVHVCVCASACFHTKAHRFRIHRTTVKTQKDVFTRDYVRGKMCAHASEQTNDDRPTEPFSMLTWQSWSNGIHFLLNGKYASSVTCFNT